MMNKLYFLFAIVLIFHHSEGQVLQERGDLKLALESSDTLTQRFKKYMNCVNAFGFSGALLVAKGDTILINEGYGWADEKNRIPITTRTFFDIGSYVKAFTATAIMQLEERGKLKVTDKITRFFKNVLPDKADITLHNLLTHTSGLVYDDFYDQISQAARDSIHNRDLYIQRILSFPKGYETGKGRSYSNTGFALLAAIIEIVSGRSYEEYVRENLFEPAGMTETGYFIPKDLKRVAHGYNDGPIDYGYPWTTQWAGNRPLWDLMGNGGMLSTLNDMYKWALAIKNNRLLSKKALDKMFTRYYTQADQAYGWNRGQDPKTKSVYITRYGDAVPQAWNMEYRWYIDEDIIFILLANKRIRAGSIRRPVMNQLVEIALHNNPLPLPAFRVNVSPKSLLDKTGSYQLASGATFHLRMNEVFLAGKKSTQILISAEGQEAIDLLYFANELKDLRTPGNDLNQKTERFLEYVIHRNTDSLKTFFSGDTIQTALALWKETEARYGKLKSYYILGTSPLNQNGSQTFIKLRFAKYTGVYKVTWRDGKLREQAEDRLQPLVTSFMRKSNTSYPLTQPLMPVTNNEFTGYDFFKNRVVNISFNQKKIGVPSLTVHTENGKVDAKKLTLQK
jgi:CubicO group peptidase (beta-lactamase class C family)